MRSLYVTGAFLLLLAIGGGGSLLTSIDELRAAHAANAANAAQLRLVQAELELARVNAIAHRDIKPSNIAVDQLCRDRVEAMRDGLRVLQRVGKVELEDFPGMRWRSW